MKRIGVAGASSAARRACRQKIRHGDERTRLPECSALGEPTVQPGTQGQRPGSAPSRRTLGGGTIAPVNHSQRLLHLPARMGSTLDGTVCREESADMAARVRTGRPASVHTRQAAS
jgi:hypothetical protein